MSTDKIQIMSVRWVDSATSEGWQDEQDVRKEALKVHTVGFLVRESESTLTLALTRSRLGEGATPWCHTIAIPKCSIYRREVLTECMADDSDIPAPDESHVDVTFKQPVIHAGSCECQQCTAMYKGKEVAINREVFLSK
jgi:hypothetical protein